MIPMSWDTSLQQIIQTLISVIGGGFGAWLTLYKGFLDHYFNKKLQLYIKDLNLDNIRKQQDFTLYTTKRHEIYLKLY